jgi:hypothetical protein
VKHNKQKTVGIDGVIRTGGRRVGFLYASKINTQKIPTHKNTYENKKESPLINKQHSQEKKEDITGKITSLSGGFRIDAQTNIETILRPIRKKVTKKLTYDAQQNLSPRKSPSLQKTTPTKNNNSPSLFQDQDFYDDDYEEWTQKSKTGVRIKESYVKVRPPSSREDTFIQESTFRKIVAEEKGNEEIEDVAKENISNEEALSKSEDVSFIKKPIKEYEQEYVSFSQEIVDEEEEGEFQQSLQIKPSYEEMDIGEDDAFIAQETSQKAFIQKQEEVASEKDHLEEKEETSLREHSLFQESFQKKSNFLPKKSVSPKKPALQRRMSDIVRSQKPLLTEKETSFQNTKLEEKIPSQDTFHTKDPFLTQEEIHFADTEVIDSFNKKENYEMVSDENFSRKTIDEGLIPSQQSSSLKEEKNQEISNEFAREEFGNFIKLQEEDQEKTHFSKHSLILDQESSYDFSQEDEYRGSTIAQESVYGSPLQEDIQEKTPFSPVPEEIKEKKPNISSAFPQKSLFSKLSFSQWWRNKDFSLDFGLRQFKPFALTAGVVFTLLSGGIFLSKGLALEGYVMGVSSEGFGDIETAIDEVRAFRFDLSAEHFEDAAERFEEVSDDFQAWAGILKVSHASLPVLSKVSSGSNALDAAELLSRAGKEVALAVSALTDLENPFNDDMNDTSLLDAMRTFSQHMEVAREYLGEAQEHVENIRIDHIPEDKQEAFLLLKSSLPEAVVAVNEYLNNNKIFEDMLGANGPRKYLFLFQNPYESRATGGFIGSYGFLDMKDGHIRKFFVDGIFNPDGQLSVDVIPPEPIRKISAGWSLHDSNWFADFPLSAEKAIYFYEKGGGQTVDGVIAITPTVLKRFLEMTGPIALEEYDTVITAENFMENIQYEVEYDYDKEENRPKKILDDLAPIVIERVFSGAKDVGASQILEALYSSLREKHILLYARDEEVQSLYEQAGWTGEILNTEYDYINVIHSNINGYKTDGVIDEKITKVSEIKKDGSIINTVTVERMHNGGDTPYDFFNQVNADYMRLYVPQGSQLISVEGHTKETVRDPLDYEELGFSRDSDIEAIESSMEIDEKTGTQIFQESGKTVFGNWVYVSPKEKVAVTYTYMLPFRFQAVDSSTFIPFSHLAQKQSGSSNREYSYELRYPGSWNIAWENKPSLQKQENRVYFTDEWNYDHYSSFVFEVKK